MTKHRATRPPTNYKFWARYALYRIALAITNARHKGKAKAANTTTKHKHNKTRNKF